MTRDASGKEWVMVPVEATIAQRNAGTFYSYPRDTANEVYAAMLAARPKFVVSEAMVEAGARGICAAHRVNPDEEIEGFMGERSGRTYMDSCWDDARAAIEAALNGGVK